MIEFILWGLVTIFMMVGLIDTTVGYGLGYASSSPQARSDAQAGVVMFTLGLLGGTLLWMATS